MRYALALSAIAAASLTYAHVPEQVLLGRPSDGETDLVMDKKPLVDSEALQNTINGDRLFAHAEKLYGIAKLSEPDFNHPTRVIGSAGHNGTVAYIKGVLESLGDYYTVSTQFFPAYYGNVYESRLVIDDAVLESAAPMSLTPATKDRQPVHGPLVVVANRGCDPSDYPVETEGAITFVARGECAFGRKSELSGQAGALAAVVYNTEPGTLHGTLGGPIPDHVATFGLDLKDAQPILDRVQSGKKVDASAYIDAKVESMSTPNVIAQTKNGDAENCVMLGGHSDSVPEGPGINDDGSGSISILEVAIQLAKFDVNNCVRFAWWAAEEEGLVGSTYYVDTLTEEENAKIRLFMDYDMMASPNFAYQIYNASNEVNPVGSEELRQLYVDWYEAQGLNYSFVPFDGRSDYDAFIRNGIPGCGVATGAEGVKTEEEQVIFGGMAGEWYDSCYHQLCDDLNNINMTAWEVNTKLIAHSVAVYARSLEGFPKRSVGGDVAALAGASYKPKYRGDKLIA